MASIILKYLTYRLTDKKYFLALSIGGAIFYVLCAMIAPRLIPLLEPDSYSYLEFSAFRTSFYPFFLDMMQFIGLIPTQIIYVQLLLFALAFAYCLYHFLCLRLPFLVIMAFYLAITGNIYMNAYHFSILTESLCFTLLLLTITHLLKFIYHRKIQNFIMMGLFVSIATALKPAMLPFCVGVLLTKFLFKWHGKNWKKRLRISLLAGFLPIIMIASLEQLIYSAHHEARVSLAPNHLLGKSLMLINDNFSDKKIDPAFLPLLQSIDNDTRQTKDDLHNIDNFCLRNVLFYELELFYQQTNHAYWQKWQETITASAYINMPLSDLKQRLSLQIIASNMMPFLQLLATRHISIFCVSSTTQLTAEHVLPVGYAKQYQPENSRAELIVHYLFLMLGVLFILASAVYLLASSAILCRNLRQKTARLKYDFTDNQLSIIYLILFINGYHLFLALTALSIVRYLMISYPLIILALLLVGFTWIEKLQHYLQKK